MPGSKANQPTSVVGVAWYRPEEWEILRNAAVDKNTLENTHAEWLADAERVVKQLRQKGLHIVKVDIEIADLILWCESQNIPLDGNARSKYAAFKVQRFRQ